ncbi:CBF/Mak21 family protein [Opisthorchis viverrini]|uniref:CBF/Mak21 family protein n=1 Tax=Opisthorchis viverrini TaxID=6198 RepID=A0A1S8X2J1_OPIVI|nr:CBF/Mak21 family protein [Opisthorchis viverrini]
MVKKGFHMSAVIVQEIRSFLFRPNLPERAKYYAVVFLSSLQLRNNPTQCTDDSTAQDLPVTLVKIYTAFFNATTKNALPEKLIAVLLTGLNRAVPFVSESRFEEVLVDVDSIFSLVHRSSCSISLQALAVLFQLSSCRVNIRGRYYQTLYRKLRDPEILHTSRGPSLLHLLYRSMLADPEVERLCAFAQRLLQLCLLYCSPGFVVGTLILLGKVSAVKKDVIVLNQIPVKFQVNSNEPKLHDPVLLPFTGIGPNGDDEEHFSDAPDSAEEDELSAVKSSEAVPLPTEPTLASWDHRALSKTITGNHHKDHPTGQRYRPDAREPLFARAGGQPSWPLVLLASHSHPTVALLATNLLQGKSVVYTGNPFDDFSLVHFLDRFAYKKPKANAKSKHNAPPGRVVQRKAGVTLGPRALPVNSTSFRQMSLDRIAADEQFFHSYFTFLASRTGKVANKRSGSGEESDGSVSDDEFDAYLEKHERGLIPTGDELDDEDMDELDVSYHCKKKKRSSIPYPDDEELSGDDDDDLSDHVDAYEEEDGDDGSDDEFTLNNPKSSSRISDLFASADEIGHLYAAQETERERRQRLWEQKRAADLSPRSSRFNRKRVGGGKPQKPGRMPTQIKKRGSKRRRHVDAITSNTATKEQTPKISQAVKKGGEASSAIDDAMERRAHIYLFGDHNPCIQENALHRFNNVLKTLRLRMKHKIPVLEKFQRIPVLPELALGGQCWHAYLNELLTRTAWQTIILGDVVNYWKGMMNSSPTKYENTQKDIESSANIERQADEIKVLNIYFVHQKASEISKLVGGRIPKGDTDVGVVKYGIFVFRNNLKEYAFTYQTCLVAEAVLAITDKVEKTETADYGSESVLLRNA